MEPTDWNPTDLVVAAQAGDQRALERLIAAYLPLLYNIVGRALGGHSDVDDVVQETLLRAVRDLRALRAPESFRSWLVAIAIRQISLQQRRRRVAAERTTMLDEAILTPGADSGFEDLTILRLGLTGQRRDVAEASRWLDPDDRALLSLWWQEVAGRINRAEIANANHLTIAHAGVRLQRMREQLEVSRTIVAALNLDPRCPELAATTPGWDGTPAPLWRKRLARHTRTCPVCTGATVGRIPTEKLLVGLVLVPVPAGLTAAITAKAMLAGAAAPAALPTAAARMSSGHQPTARLIGTLTQGVSAQPVAVLAITAALLTGLVGFAVIREPHRPVPPVEAWPVSPPVPGVSTATASPRPTSPGPTSPGPSSPGPSSPGPSSPRPSSARPSTSPPAPAGTVPLGPRSLESVNTTGEFLTYVGDFATLDPVSASSGRPARQRATFVVVRGLADRTCVTFRTADGRYLRHYAFRLRLDSPDGTELFREDATFCPRPGSTAGSVTLRSHNYPDRSLRPRGGQVQLDVRDGTAAFRAASSLRVRAPWAP